MEIFRRFRSKTRQTPIQPPTPAPPPDSFLYSLHIQKLQEQQRLAAQRQEEQRLAAQRQAIAIEAAREIELAKLAAQRQEEQEKLRKIEQQRLRVQALQESLVPDTMRQMGILLGIQPKPIQLLDDLVDIGSDGLYLILEYNPPINSIQEPVLVKETRTELSISQPWREATIRTYPGIIARGVEDGSVRIGPTILNPQEKLDFAKIDSALQTAYSNPTAIQIRHYWHQQYRTWGNYSDGSDSW